MFTIETEIETVKLSLNNIKFIKYNKETKYLCVFYHDDSEAFTLVGVSEEVFTDFKKALSKSSSI